MSTEAEARRAAIAELIDRNGDGYLQAGEYISAASGLLYRAGVSAAANGSPKASALIQLDAAALRERFESFRQKYAPYFAHGIEMPTDENFASLATIGRSAYRAPVHQSVVEAVRAQCSMIDDALYEIMERARQRRAKEFSRI